MHFNLCALSTALAIPSILTVEFSRRYPQNVISIVDRIGVAQCILIQVAVTIIAYFVLDLIIANNEAIKWCCYAIVIPTGCVIIWRVQNKRIALHKDIETAIENADTAIAKYSELSNIDQETDAVILTLRIETEKLRQQFGINKSKKAKKSQ